MHRRGELGRSGEDSRTRNPYGCNGEYTDPATGFQYLRSRYYNGRTGSFLTEDSHGGNVLEPLSQNRYTYTGNNPLNLKDPGGHAWVSGILGKVKSAVSKSTSAKPGVVKSGAAAVAKEKIKKIVTSTRNTASTNSQKSKGTSRQNTGGDIKNAAAKQRKAVTSSSKGAGSSSAKKGWESAILGGISGKVASVVRRLTPGHAYVNNKLLTAISEKERKLCSGAGRILKDAVTAAAGLAKGINRAIMDIWNGSMSVNPMGRLFLKEGKRIVPTVGNTVMEIAKRVIKEQEEERKQEEMRKKQEAIGKM